MISSVIVAVPKCNDVATQCSHVVMGQGESVLATGLRVMAE